jgi:GT2 family glycosyltransferase
MFLAVNATSYRAIGGFDERYFLYCEDYDLCARLYLAGYSLTRNQLVAVEHMAQRDSHRRLRWLVMHLKSLVRVWITPVFWRVLFSEFRSGASPAQT